MASPPTKTTVRFDPVRHRFYGEIHNRRGELLHTTPREARDRREAYAAAKEWLAQRKKARAC